MKVYENSTIIVLKIVFDLITHLVFNLIFIPIYNMIVIKDDTRICRNMKAISCVYQNLITSEGVFIPKNSIKTQCK